MVKQYSENQYDDDLTVGTDDYDDSYYTGSVDLFEFANDEESPISRLKSLILSIDWEITDEILMQFNEELVDLRDIWAGEKINLVYVQALEKISKYIYQKKADSHPSAIKLLLTLYHNLEKIVSSDELSEEEKREILLEDVKRFENLKRHIAKPSAEPADQIKQVEAKAAKPKKSLTTEKDLYNLKAIVLGIDWEITDQDLNELRREVIRLEEKFADSRPKLILLQGIGTLGAYIKLKKSNTHSDAFKVLHLFYESLEKIVSTPMTLEEEKAILFPAVEKFNSFKTLLGPTIAPEAINRREAEDGEEENQADSSVIAPAFSDLPEEEVKGFQAEEEAQALGLQSPDSVDDHVESFFTGSGFQTLETVAESRGADAGHGDLKNMAVLQGVDVEIDDEEEDEISLGGGLAPALSDSVEDTSADKSVQALADDEVTEDEEAFLAGEDIEEKISDGDFPFGAEEGAGLDFGTLDKDIVLEGVKVETEADDDSDEEALPMLDGELAPALAENDEVSIYNAEVLERSSDIKNMDDEISGTLGKFFDEEMEPQLAQTPDMDEEEEDLDLVTEPLQSADEPAAVAAGELEETDDLEESLSFFDEEQLPVEGEKVEEVVEEAAEPEEEAFPFTMEEAAAEEEQQDLWNEPELESETEEETLAFVSELDQDESLEALLDESDIAEGEGEVEGPSAKAQEEPDLELDEKLDAFFDVQEEAEEPDEDKLLFSLTEEETLEEELAEKEDIDQPIAAAFEEEVVFQLVEEDEELEEPLIAAEPIVDQDEEGTFEVELSAEEEIAPLALTEIEEEEEQEVEEEPEVEEIKEEVETVEEVPVDVPPETETEVPASDYSQLRTCVDSLGLELDDTVISALLEEVERLEQHLTDRPLEKSFLQLASTLTRHIDQNRYDSSPEAFGLLQSTSNAMAEVRENDLTANLQLLFTETQKVLKWQEDLLAQQIASDEAQLTIGDPLASGQDSEQSEVSQSAQESSEKATAESEGGDVEAGAVGTEKDTTIPVKPAEENQHQAAGDGGKKLTEDLKLEISTLRQTLQDEIAALRKELKK